MKEQAPHTEASGTGSPLDLDAIEKRMQRFYAHGLTCNEEEQVELLAVFREVRQLREENATLTARCNYYFAERIRNENESLAHGPDCECLKPRAARAALAGEESR